MSLSSALDRVPHSGVQPHTQKLRLFFPSAACLLTDHRPNGEGLIAFNLLSRLAERGHEVTACAREVDIASPYAFRVVEVGHTSSHESIEPLRYARRVQSEFDALGGPERFDVVHWLFPPGDEEILFRPPARVPYVIGPQSLRWPKSRARISAGAVTRLLLRPVFRRAGQRAWGSASAVLVSIPAARSSIPMSCTAATHLLPFGIDPSAFVPKPLPHKPTVAYIGRLQQQKGVEDLVEAFRVVRQTLPQARLLIAGDGPARPRLEQQLRSIAPSAVEFLGGVAHSEISQVLARASLLCVPSHGEPFGMVILEAMACGRAAVAYDWGGPEFLVDRVGGALVPPGLGPTGLGTAMANLLLDKRKLEEMGIRNRSRIESRFSWEHIVGELENVYLSAMKLCARSVGVA